MKINTVLICSLVYLCSALSSFAGNIVDKATQAEALIQEGKLLEGYYKAESALEIAWEKLPLTFRNIHLVDSITGYGLYVKRKDNIYQAGDKIFIYAEALGFAYGQDAVGNMSIGFDVGIDIFDTSDKRIFSIEKMGSFSSPVRHKNREFNVHLNVNTGNMKPGKYKAIFNLRDLYSDKQSDIAIEFGISEKS